VVLLNKRLLPYCAAKDYVSIRELDNLDVVTKFVESWVNLQPTRNRKDVPLPTKPVLLQDTTKKAEVERLRYFLRYCVDRGWLSTNHAEKITFSVKTKKKFGMESEEEQRFFNQIETHCIDGRGGNGGYNAQQLRVFCLVMRHAGLRISDAAALNEEQLVPRMSGEGWALRVYQKKTKDWVYVPLSTWVADELRELPFRGAKGHVRYWFWRCDGERDTCENNWYRRISKIVKAVDESHPFLNPVSPHSFRHTFAISHLNAGTDIKFVSRWLGHASTAVTEAHYAHAIRSTLLASEAAYDESVLRHEALRRKHAFALSSAAVASAAT
jgi:integrase